jgi:hypothetical protein
VATQRRKQKPKAPKAKRAKLVLTRVDLVRITSDETLADLERKMRTSSGHKDTKAARLSEIVIADKVFQWRRSEHNLLSREDHVFELAKAIKQSGKPLEPILVLPVRDHYYVIDGHHRVEAYHSVKWKPLVPVEVFHGSLRDARIEAFRRNSKDKLPMSKQDKMEGTWTLVKEGELTVEAISDITHASERQIYYMRNALKKVKKHSELKRSLEQLSWMQAKALLSGADIEWDPDNWIDKKAQKIVDALLKANIGQGLIKHPDITAVALERLNASLPRALIHAWFSPDEMHEMADEVGKYEF